MLKYNNTHIFTGYLKQLLSSFNLPACRVYTKEFANYRSQFNAEDPRVIESFDTFVYHSKRDQSVFRNRIASYSTYLKGNEFFNYVWPSTKDGQTAPRQSGYWARVTSNSYDRDSAIPGLTKTLSSRGAVYDAVTHEYLGDYLRFLRDYYGVDLMPLYNCFNNSLCNNILNYSFNVTDNSQNRNTMFDSRDSRFRIYAIPVKLFSSYTIAIDCNHEIEMFCGIYNKTMNESVKAKNLSAKTYTRINRALFRQPFVYDKLSVNYWGFDQSISSTDSTGNTEKDLPDIVNSDVITRWDIANQEQDLRLFIKIPITCKSSIVILEGDYSSFNDCLYKPKSYVQDNGSLRTVLEYKQNHSILNFQNGIDLNNTPIKLVTKLQLLALNTGESYPFSDRLIEYLCGSAITPLDEIPDNIRRIQKVMTDNKHYFKVNGLWEDKIQKITYDYLINSGPIALDKGNDTSTARLVDHRRGYHPTLGHSSKSMLYDTLGYIDRDAEKWYASWKLDENSGKVHSTSIQNADIYNGLFDI